MASISSSFHVLIIGAGSAGLLMAQALKKQGINSTVYEQDAAIDARPRDWNYGIYWAMTPLAECLPEELSELVESTQVDSRKPSPDDVLAMFNGKTGELLQNASTPTALRLQRRRFLKLISTGLNIEYGKKLMRCQTDGETVQAFFEDGTQAKGNLLIGAEGAHSKVREFLAGKEQAALVPSPIVASATMAKLPKHVALKFAELHPRALIAFHPLGTFSWFGVHDAVDGSGPGQWTFMIIHSWKADQDQPAALEGASILHDFRERAQAFAEPFKSFFEAIPDGTKCWHNRLSYWIPERWNNHNNTVTLIGDAAHPMTFHRGQGLNNAIHDVASLARSIREKRLVELGAQSGALSAYEQEMCTRGKEAVTASNQNSLAIHDWDTLLKSPLFTSGLSQKLTNQSNSTK